ncbi:MAG: glycine--tRNA ligase subunit beta [Rhizobiales bacterium]|nr:glycine--tRNA ligase subunit beta [Hyphomicrobiales bacterium]NRB13458.1 glycine--tRNA ligase subunit beta [Hyphomicrobiales bacterium]
MAELFIELFSEEIPSRMQNTARADLGRLVSGFLKAAGLKFGAVETYATPRRLCVKIADVPTSTPDINQQRKGPQVGAPEQAIQGFLRGAGVTLEQCVEQEIKGKTFYVAMIEKSGQQTAEIIAASMPELINKFPWPKSMRWGAGSLKWVRPLQSIICLFGGDVVPFEIENVPVGDSTQGHLFMNNARFSVKDFADYRAKLLAANVMLNGAEREAVILAEAQVICAKAGLELIDDKSLIAETAGLVEWPVALLGEFEIEFLDVPQRVIIETIKGHQKCFAVIDPKTKKLSHHFVAISNMIADDGGKTITHGNEKVIRARLSDANYFWQTDKKTKLADRVEKLKNITFHAKLGSQHQRVEAIKEIAEMLCEFTHADKAKTLLAVELSKADLVTHMVGELPELQGYMGQQYALAEGIDADVAEALAQHYAPQGPSDAVPTNIIALTVSLADKFNTLLGFWSIDEKPTGSKDPYALRRAALGIIRIVMERNLRLDIPAELLPFFIDRLKVYFREQGLRHDLIDAVFALKGQNDLVLAEKRVIALADFLATDDGANLLAGVKRANNILQAEDKKQPLKFNSIIDEKLLVLDAERHLFAAITKNVELMNEAVKKEDFAAAMTALAQLRQPIDSFFEDVKVNDDDAAIRINRLKLLFIIRTATKTIADFSRVEG